MTTSTITDQSISTSTDPTLSTGIDQTTSTTTEQLSNQQAMVRFLAAPAPVRTIFRLLEWGAPSVGGWWAERIWFTLPRPRALVGTAKATPPPGGRPIDVRLAGRVIAGTTWGSGPTIYLLHGWAGSHDQLTAFISPLVERGHQVVAFDAPSHGRSAPGAYGARSSSIPEFASALRAVVAAHGPARAIIAHSAGATAAAIALCDGLDADRLALLAPMASPAAYARQFANLLGAGDRVHRNLVARVERRVGPLRHLEVPELGRAIQMPPTLIVHDRGDTSMSADHGAAIAAAWPSSRLHLTSGLGHRRLLRAPEVVAEIVDFLVT